MKLTTEQNLSCDVLVIGGGGAGLRAAMAARQAGAEVLLVSKSKVGLANNTYISKATFSAVGFCDSVQARADSAELHIQDTLRGGRGLNDIRRVTAMVHGVPQEIPFLEQCGVRFAKSDDQRHYCCAQAPGHTYARNVHPPGRWGRELIEPMTLYAQQLGVRFIHKSLITRLFSVGGQIAGAAGIDHMGGFLTIAAGAVVLATGGYARIYHHCNNASGITGDGAALAYALGVGLKDMEFVQYYPTALGANGTTLLLYEDFVMQAGATLVNAEGEKIPHRYGISDPMQLTRDRLSRIIMHEILAGRGIEGGVIMDFSAVPESALQSLRHLLPSGWTAGRRRFVVTPTAHFCMGGVVCDENGQTELQGLLGAGEVSVGVHGANRLGGNALAEVFALGASAGIAAARHALQWMPAELPSVAVAAEKARLEAARLPAEGLRPTIDRLKRLMWEKAGPVRNAAGLGQALEAVTEMGHTHRPVAVTTPPELLGVQVLENMRLVCEMVCRAALMRQESRGAHYRSDYADEDNHSWLKNIVIRQTDEEMTLNPEPPRSS